MRLAAAGPAQIRTGLPTRFMATAGQNLGDHHFWAPDRPRKQRVGGWNRENRGETLTESQ